MKKIIFQSFLLSITFLFIWSFISFILGPRQYIRSWSIDYKVTISLIIAIHFVFGLWLLFILLFTTIRYFQNRKTARSIQDKNSKIFTFFNPSVINILLKSLGFASGFFILYHLCSLMAVPVEVYNEFKSTRGSQINWGQLGVVWLLAWGFFLLVFTIDHFTVKDK
ncbi:MAG: hypothetical protein WBA17_07255 [Saprospiraceae bacterium]